MFHKINEKPIIEVLFVLKDLSFFSRQPKKQVTYILKNIQT